MTDITMPQLSDAMEEGTILSWLKRDGELVTAGEDLVEIETDKATVTYAAEAAGALTIVVHEGGSARVGEPIARLGDAVAPAPREGVDRAPAAKRDGDPRATPLARRVAVAHGVVLADVPGSGPHGRITRADVLRNAGIAPSPPTVPVAPVAQATPDDAARGTRSNGEVTRREPTRLQQVVARRMAEANATVPHFQVQTDVVMDAAIALRADFKRVAGEEHAIPSLNDLVIKAAAVALRDHPLANASYTDGGFELYEQINVGMAVAADDALVVPTIFDAGGKSLGHIALETRRLAARVREGTISPAELSGGTFTVSNLGMFGMTAITPVVNTPQAAILGVGAIRTVLARVDGELADRALMTLTLSCDHRILYGADAARFLDQVRRLLEEPLLLAL